MMLSSIYLKILPRSISRYGIISSETAFRYVRSIARRQPVDSMQTLKGKVKTDHGEFQIDDDFTHLNDLKGLKRMVEQVFVNTDETQTAEEYDLEEDYGADFEHAEKFYDINQQEEKGHKSMVKKNIIKKKYFKEPRETNLLTYAAKMQIRHLHQLDPIKWTPEALAESFPVSVNGVKKLLKNNYRTNDEEKIKRHDADVAKKWKLLESGNIEFISPVTAQLYHEGKITRDHHAGNFYLPLPVIEENVLDSKPKKIGEHASMIKYYLDLKKKPDTNEVSLVTKDEDHNLKLSDDKNDRLLEQRDIQRTVLPEFKSRYPSRAEMESMRSASYLATEKPDPDEIEMPQSQFEENLLQEFSEKPSKSKSSIDASYEEWLQNQISEKSESSDTKPQPFDPKDFFEAVKKYNDDAIELNLDQGGAYLYDENLGYQRPFQRVTVSEHIKIPKEKYVPGALYRVGKKFYADDGTFLFKVHVLKDF